MEVQLWEAEAGRLPRLLCVSAPGFLPTCFVPPMLQTNSTVFAPSLNPFSKNPKGFFSKILLLRDSLLICPIEFYLFIWFFHLHMRVCGMHLRVC